MSITQGTDGTSQATFTGSEQSARSFVSFLIQQEFEKAAAYFDENMKGAVTPRKLKAIWMDQLTRSGTCQKIENTRIEPYLQYQIIFVTCRFEKQQVDVKLVIDAAKTLNQPMLILQGGQDCQVNPKDDFKKWQQALSVRKDVILTQLHDLKNKVP